jgi:hypothetical protein
MEANRLTLKKRLFYATGLMLLLLPYAIVVLLLPSYLVRSFFITEDMIPSPLVWLASVVLIEFFVVCAITYVVVDPIRNIDVIVMGVASAIAANLLMLIGFLMRTLPRMVELQVVLLVGFALYALYFHLVKLPRRTQQTIDEQLAPALHVIHMTEQFSDYQPRVPVH